MSRCGGLLESSKKHVLFMHQTVKEFFVREELWIHLLVQESQSSFDPRLALLSACILRLKCLEELIHRPTGVGCSFSHDYIYIADSMHYAASSEDHGANKKAYFCLLDELDSTCTKLARAFVLLHKIKPELVDGYHWSRFEPGRKNISRDDSLLSLAAQAGLASYVASKISSGDIPVGAKFGKPLLAYAVSLQCDGMPLLVFMRARNYDGVGYNLPDVRVLKLLLSFGVDTNEQYDNTTVWKEAVKTGCDIFAPNRSLSARGIPAAGINARNKRRWIETMKIMLRHGANLEDPCFIEETDVPAKQAIRRLLQGRLEYAKDLEELEQIFNERVSTV